MEDKIHLLYQQILCATKNGHDAEVRRDKDGNFVVYSVKKQRADKIRIIKVVEGLPNLLRVFREGLA